MLKGMLKYAVLVSLMTSTVVSQSCRGGDQTGKTSYDRLHEI